MGGRKEGGIGAEQALEAMEDCVCIVMFPDMNMIHLSVRYKGDRLPWPGDVVRGGGGDGRGGRRQQRRAGGRE